MTATGQFKVTQGHRFWYRSKRPYATSVSECIGYSAILYPTISHRFASYRSNYRTIINGSNCRFSQWVLLFNSTVRGETLNSVLRNLTINVTLSCGAQHIFRYAKPRITSVTETQADWQNSHSNFVRLRTSAKIVAYVTFVKVGPACMKV